MFIFVTYTSRCIAHGCDLNLARALSHFLSFSGDQDKALVLSQDDPWVYAHNQGKKEGRGGRDCQRVRKSERERKRDSGGGERGGSEREGERGRRKQELRASRPSLSLALSDSLHLFTQRLPGFRMLF